MSGKDNVRQVVGEPDPFRFRHQVALRQIVREVLRGRMGRKAANTHIASWAEENIAPDEREYFREVAETELHEGNFARYQIRPNEFAAWQTVWKGTATG